MPEREQQQDSGNPRPSDRTHEIEARPRLLLKATNGSSLGEAAGSARDTIKRGSVIFSKKNVHVLHRRCACTDKDEAIKLLDRIEKKTVRDRALDCGASTPSADGVCLEQPHTTGLGERVIQWRWAARAPC
jgi:hypothetical protein